MKKKTVVGQLLRLLQLLIVPVIYYLTRVASKVPEIVETVYSNGVYPVIRNAVSAFTRLFPFSLVEYMACFLAVLFAVIFFVRFVRLLKMKEDSFVKLLSFIISLVLFAGYLFSAFYIMWGFNYFRPSVDKKLGLPNGEYTKEELYEVCLDLAEHAKELREKVTVNTSGVFCGDLDRMQTAVQKAYSDFGATRPDFKADVPPAKALLSSEYFSQRGISGIYIFLTEEPNINVNEPFLYIPFSAAHETAHYLGYAREEDASFIAFLVCRDSEDAYVAYSGYMHALVNCGNALAGMDMDLYSALRSTYSAGMDADFADYSEYYNKYKDTEEFKASNDMNDSYLKFNDQPKGVASYEEDVLLILRLYDSERFFS